MYAKTTFKNSVRNNDYCISFIIGCNNDVNDGLDDCIISDDTVVLEEEDVENVIEEITPVNGDPANGYEVTIPSESDLAASLAVGNILVYGSSEKLPGGMLQKIESIDSAGESTLFHTVPAALNEAFEEMHMDYSFDLDPEDIVKSVPLVDGVTFTPGNESDSSKSRFALNYGFNVILAEYAGATHDFEYTWWTVPSSSDYKIFFIVDPGELIMETDEDNNETSIMIFANVDLEAKAIEDDGGVCYGGVCQENMEATFTAQVVNLSNADINEEIIVRWEVCQCNCSWLIDTVDQYIPGLAAGATYDFEYTWMIPDYELECYPDIYFTVDPDDSIMEPNENNNVIIYNINSIY